MARTGRPSQWSDARIEAELRPVVAEIGRMPSSDDLRRRGLCALRNAVTKRGGFAAWAERMGVRRAGADRRAWSEETVLTEVRRVADRLGRMPSVNELQASGNNALACIIPHHGGYHAIALRLGLAQKGTETHFAQRWERVAVAFYAAHGASVERMGARHPFDLRVNGARVDVKAARPTAGGFVFAGLKRGERCDFFHLVCVRQTGEALAHFVVPADEARVCTVSMPPSLAGKYARFRDAFGSLMTPRSKAA